MAKRKFKFLTAEGLQRVIEFDPNATEGATLGTDLLLPDGTVATPETLADWLGASGTGVGEPGPTGPIGPAGPTGPATYVRGAAFVAPSGLTTSVASVAVYCDRAGTISRVVTTGNTAGDATVGIKKVAAGSYTGVASGASIVGSDPPTLASAAVQSKTSFTGWTLSVSAGDILIFSLSSVSGLSAVTVQVGITT